MKDINLLPEDIKSTTTYTPAKSGSGVSVKAVIVIIFVLLFIAGTLVAPKIYTKTLERTLDRIQKEIEDPKYDVVKKVKIDINSVDAVINRKSNIMNDIDAKSYPINEILVTINNAVPNGCKISSLMYEGTNLTIAGNATDAIAIAELVSKLQRLDFIEIASNFSVNQDNTFNISLNVGRKEGN